MRASAALRLASMRAMTGELGGRDREWAGDVAGLRCRDGEGEDALVAATEVDVDIEVLAGL